MSRPRVPPADRVERTWGWDSHGIRGVVAGSAFSLRVRRMSPTSDLDEIVCAVPRAGGNGGTRCGLDAFQRFLWGHRYDAAAREALDTLDGDILPHGSLDLIRAHPDLALRHELFYCLDWSHRSGRVAAATRHPSLANVLSGIVARVYRRGEDPAEYDVRDLLARYAPGALPGSIRSVMRMERPIGTSQALRALLALPPERHPVGEREYRAFEAVVMASADITRLLGNHDHLASWGKGWVAFALSLLGRLPDGSQGCVLEGPVDPVQGAKWPALDRACMDARDAASALARQVLAPLLHASGRADEPTVLELSGVGTDISEYDAPVFIAAARSLYAGKSLQAILELSASWHARQRAVDARVRGIGERFPSPDALSVTAGTWPVPFRPCRAPNGTRIVFLGSQAELDLEGAALNPDGSGGLDHCVGGYGPDCASGHASIASLRTGGGVRLATAQVSLRDTRLTVVQHRGAKNSDPPRAARAAMAWLVAEVAAGRVVAEGDFLARGWRKTGGAASVSGRCGYDHLVPGAAEAALAAWGPYLTRPLRDPATLVDGAWRAVMDAEPPPRPSHPRGPLDRMRGNGQRAYGGFCHAILLPLWLADRGLDGIMPRASRATRDGWGMAAALCLEVAMLWGIHAIAGPAWLAVLAVQLAVPVALLAWEARGIPGAVARTVGHAARATTANRRRRRGHASTTPRGATTPATGSPS